MTTKAQQSALGNALVAPENQRVIGNSSHLHASVLGQEFDEPPSEEEALSFIRELGHSREIKYITHVIVDHLHQLWRTFASIINKCLCGKAYQIDNKDSKKQDKMFYPRFTKIIIHHFLEKDKSISMRNRTFMHTTRDDSLLGTMRFVSRHEGTQVYGAILPKSMTNQAMLDSVAYKTYYAIASGAEPPKSKKPKRKSDSTISSEETPSKKKPIKAKKDVPSTKKPTTKPKPTKKKVPVKADRGKSLNVLSEVALSEASRLKEVTKRSKKYFHISHASGSGDSGEEDDDDDDEDDTEDDEGNDDGDGNDSDDDNDGDNDDGDDDDNNDGNDDDDSDHERTESDRDENANLNQFNEEHEEEEEEENVDEFIDKEYDLNNANKENEEELDDGEELYKDVNVNLRKEDVEMTNADQSGADQHNVSQEYGFEQEEEDAHVTLTAVHDTQKTEANNEIASLMDTSVRHEEPSGQTFTLFTVPITTIHPPPHFFNPLPQQATPTPTPTTLEATTSFPALPDFSSVFKFNDRVTKLKTDLSEMKQVDQYAQVISSIPAIILTKAISDFATPVIEQNVIESLEVAVLARSSSQPKSTYEAAASLSEYELAKILLDKTEESKSHLKDDYKRELSDALVKFYNTDKDLFETYDPRSNEGKSSSSSKDTSRSYHKSSGKPAHTEEPSHTVDDSKVKQNQEFNTGNNDEQPDDEAAPEFDCNDLNILKVKFKAKILNFPNEDKGLILMRSKGIEDMVPIYGVPKGVDLVNLVKTFDSNYWLERWWTCETWLEDVGALIEAWLKQAKASLSVEHVNLDALTLGRMIWLCPRSALLEVLISADNVIEVSDSGHNSGPLQD
ncbi:hypothetical protein Tco_0396160 [Tanacetum coccineum]